MPPLTDTQTKSDTDSSSGSAPSDSSEKSDASASQSVGKSLGYEVLYGRKITSVQVPLYLSKSLSTPEVKRRSTGSALLDSLVSDRIVESLPLRNLRLISVSDRVTRSVAVADTPRQTSAPKPAPEQTATAEPEDGPTQSPVTARAMPSATIPLQERPPAAAEPDTLDEIDLLELERLEAERQESEKLEAERLEAERLEANRRRAKQVSPPAVPARAPRTQPAGVKRPVAFSPAIADGKKARDNAASVGLIDLNDTLLFGGDRHDLASTDPFVDDSHSPDGSSEIGVISYISQQISAFTVSKLKNGFPYNTDPKIINRANPPNRSTVLGLKDFKLGNLTALDEDPPAARQTQPPRSASNSELSALSQQVKMLNRKIADLSQKLAQVTKE